MSLEENVDLADITNHDDKEKEKEKEEPEESLTY